MADFPSPAQIPVAIVGMACRLPGASNLDEYWKLLVEGRSAVRELPPDRLDRELYFDPAVGVRGKTYSTLAAILDSRQFDSAACPVPPALAASVDSAHLLMCEVAAAALRHGQMDPWNLRQRNVGVYVGHAQGSTLGGDYTYATCVEEAAHILEDVDEFRRLSPTQQKQIIRSLVDEVRAGLPQRTADSPDVAANLVAGTISKALGLTGPFLAINSACASSLQAILCGVRALQLGRIEMAIVGGASDCKSDSLVLFSHAQAMSATGSRPFDADADGLIVSEGYVALVLKTLEQALADGDPIQAVIRGLGVASDGKGKSLWAPRKEGQLEAMRRAYRDGLDMSRLQYVEAHATATQLGDATELNTLAEALGPVLPAGSKIPIASVKANIGHSLETAGLAGVVKIVLAMQRGTIPPAINIRKLNPKIQWDKVPYYVPREAAPWARPADGHPRRAAVNAFGIGGLNMHVVVDEYMRDAGNFYFPPQSAETPSRMKSDHDAVAIVGRGCVLPGAHNMPAFWQMLLAGSDPKCNVPDARWRTDLFCEPGTSRAYRSPTALGGFVRDFAYDWRVHKVPPKQIAEADPLQFMLLEAADEALQESGCARRSFDRKRVGVLVGTEFGGDFTFQLQLGLRLPHMQKLLARLLERAGVATGERARILQKFPATLLKRWPALIDETGSFSTSSLASRISKTWDFMGGAAAVDAGGSSSLAVLALAVDQLLAGDVDMMICAAGQRRLGLPAYEALSLTGMAAADSKPRSRFDSAAGGYVPGEGVAVVLLKRLSDARRDGDQVLAIIRGVGAGHSDSITESLRLAIERSCEIGNVDPAEISVLEAEGPAVPDIRDAELRAILAAHGSRRGQPLRLGSLVGQIGHLDGAAGMAALVKASLEIEHGVAPGELALTRAVDAVAQQPKLLEVAAEQKQLASSSDNNRRLAAVSTVSRGLAYHAVLEHPAAIGRAVNSAEQPPVAVKTSGAPGWRIVRSSAATMGELVARAAALQRSSESAFDAADKSCFSPADRFRLAVVVDSPVMLAEKLSLLQAGERGRKCSLDELGIFLRERPTSRPRLACVFPGQGSQYTGMLAALIQQSPTAAAALKDSNPLLAEYGFESFSELVSSSSSKLGIDPWHTQAAMLLADHLTMAAVAGLGIQPDLVFGHSYGEYAALLAAGAWDLKTALAVTKTRCDAIAACSAGKGRMLAVAASPEVVERLARQCSVVVYVANHNAPEQTVVAGHEADLRALAERLRAESVGSQLLKVPCPFHSPLVAGACGPLQRAVQDANIVAPCMPFYSVVTNSAVGDPDEIRGNLVAHLIAPVRYVDLIQRIASEHPTAFLEVGPQQVLTKLHRRILCNEAVECMSCDDAKQRGIAQLLRVRAWLECLGVLEGATEERSPMVRPQRHEILQFDATARRREKMRAGASASAAAEVKPAASSPEQFRYDEAPDAGTPVTVAVAPQAAAPIGHSESTNGEVKKSAAAPRTASRPAIADLEKFLIQFVVEQTGYPPEVVELDADLEADLGIDSIKKAQLFGELQEYFDVTPDENLTLDDFPTLRHVLDFLAGASTDGVVSPPPMKRMEIVEPSPAAAAAPAPATATTNASELEKFLIQFVVEQTGYPPEVVELDADLEADLGIDSIKKAQLFGELQEYFDVTPSENLTLDDFPTLRHVLDFLAGSGASSQSTTPLATSPPILSPAPPDDGAPLRLQTASNASIAVTAEVALAPTPVQWDQPAAALAADFATKDDAVLVAELQGTPYEIGLALGRQHRRSIVRALRRYADIVGPAPIDDGARATPSLAASERSELDGVAEGASVPVANLLALGVDALAPMGAPTSAVIERTSPDRQLRLLLGVDAPLSGAMCDCIRPCVQLRRPTSGLPHALVTWLGGVGALCGLNAARVAAMVKPGANGSAHDLTTAHLGGAQAVKAVLSSAGDLSAGIAIAKQVRADGPWAISIQHAGQAAEVAYDGRTHSVTGDEPTADNESFNSETRGAAGLAADQQLAAAIDPAAGALWIKPADNGRATSWQAIALDTLLDGYELPAQPAADVPAEHPKRDMSHRFVMRMAELDLPADAPKSIDWQGPALVVGENPTADALRQALSVAGAEVHHLTGDGDVDSALAAFETLWRKQPIPHVFLMASRDDEAIELGQPQSWQRVRSRDAIVPFFLCQRWLQLCAEAGLLDQADHRLTLVVGTSLGGDFGFSGKIPSPTGGALTGLVKAIYLEYRVMRQLRDRMIAKVVDAPADEPPDLLAANILRELAAGTVDYEVAYVNGRRRLQAAVHCPAMLAGEADIRQGSVWVATGGARGITAECALELGRRFGLKLHLIGTSPQPACDPAWRNLTADGLQTLKASVMIEASQAGRKPAIAWEQVQKAIEIDRTLASLATEGIRATYHACDVSDRAALARTLEKIRALDGPIEGILHGAGIDRSCRFERKNRDDVNATVGAKVDGAYNLMALTRDDPLRHFISFGSISGRLGSNGQTDYCLASDLLVKLTTWFAGQRPECRTIAWHWHPWDEVGMAYRPETRATFQMSDAPALMPKREGIAHFIRELYARGRENEALITDWDYFRRFYGDGAPAASIVQDGPPTEQELATSSKHIASRYILRMIDAPLDSSAADRVQLAGPAIILGENTAAWALAAKLESTGVAARVLPGGDDVQAALERFDRAWSTAPAPTLLVMTGRDQDAQQIWDESGWRRRRRCGIDVSLAIVRRWLSAISELTDRPPATLLAAVNLGGDFGLSPSPIAPEGGALAGLLKSLYIENSRQSRDVLRVKVVDAPAGESPADLATAICQELSVDTPAVEVAWSAGRRRVLETVPAGELRLADRDLSPGVWVVTGGARGITAAAALALGRRYDLRLHLIGKSPAPLPDSPWLRSTDDELKAIKQDIVRRAIAEGRLPDEEWNRVKKDIEIHESLEKYAAAGVAATYHCCDVADRGALAAVLERVRQIDGPIDGILHGAGYAKTARFETKDAKAIDQTFAAKVDGAAALLALTRNDPLKYFVGFGSISGRYGGNGLADYAAANDMLAKLLSAARHERPECAYACIHWQSWDEIGMAMFSDAVGITKSTLKMEFLSPSEGIAHLDRELRAGLPVTEVAITDGYFQRMMYPHAFEANGHQASSSDGGPGVRAPLIDGVMPAGDGSARGGDGSARAHLRLDPRRDPFLIHHRLKGKPFLPGAVCMETMAQTAAMAAPGRKVAALKDVEFVNGLMFHGDEPIDAEVSFSRTAAGYDCTLTANLKDRKGRMIDAHRLCARGTVELADDAAQLAAPPPGVPPHGWFEHRYPDQALLAHGPPLRCLVQCALQYDGGWGRIVAPAASELAGERSAEGWILPIAALDGCLVACGSWVYLQFAGRLEVPYGFERLTPVRAPRAGENCIVRLFFRGQDAQQSRFDFTLFGEDDTVILDAVDYRTIRLGSATAEKAKP